MAGFGEQKKKQKSTAQRKTYLGVEILHKTGVDHHMNGNLVDAEKAYRAAIKTGYLNSATFLNLGVICKNSGRSEEAVYLYKKAIAISPNNPNAYTNLGDLFRALGQLDQALASTLKSLKLKPNNPDALINLGGIYKDHDQLDRALESTLKALEINPDHPIAHMNLGGIYKDLGQLDKALTSTLKSIALNPDNPDAQINLGGIYKDLGHLNKALTSTLKSLQLKPDNPTTHMNLGGIYRDLGQLDKALESTLKALELNPDHPTAHMNLGVIYKELGNLDKALDCLRKAMKSEETKEEGAVELAQTYYSLNNYLEGIKAIRNINSKRSGNLLLSLYLCLDEKLEFIQCSYKLINKRWLNSQGIAAIDHANVIYNQNIDNGLKGRSTIDSVVVQNINEKEFSDELLQQILNRLSSDSLQLQFQGLLTNGSQTSGNILEIPEKPFQVLKEIIIQKINVYNQACKINTDKDFLLNIQKNKYSLKGWAVIMDKGGNLTSHNHELGWQSGTFYLQMPEQVANTEEGCIEFTHQGPRYPEGASEFEKRIIRPNTRDLNIFSSALFHRTLPFDSESQRICIAFDVTRNEMLWDAFN